MLFKGNKNKVFIYLIPKAFCKEISVFLFKDQVFLCKTNTFILSNDLSYIKFSPNSSNQAKNTSMYFYITSISSLTCVVISDIKEGDSTHRQRILVKIKTSCSSVFKPMKQLGLKFWMIHLHLDVAFVTK